MVRDHSICHQHIDWFDGPARAVVADTDRGSADLANVALAQTQRLNCGVADNRDASFALHF